MKTGGKVLLGLLAVGVGVAGVAAMNKSTAPSTATPPLKGATVFGDPAKAGLPADFDGDGNDIHFNADCSTIVVGRQFVVSASSCVASWNPNNNRMRDTNALVSVKDALHDGESLCAFIDYLMVRENIDDAKVILAAIVTGLEPPCLSRPSAEWPEAMRKFVNWLGVRVNAFVIDAGGRNPNPDEILA